MIERIRNIGPGALVTAAFIGPGTVTACTLAGVNFGYALLWALLFATLATIVLQEMAARLGVVTQRGLGETLAQLLKRSIWRWPLIVLVGLALYLGNAAYEAGNLSGAALGIAAIAGESEAVFAASIVTIALLASVLLLAGTYKLVERVLLALVAIMAASFVATFAIVRPDLGGMATGLLVPSIPDGALLTVIALIGTTVVPYNLFLHSSAVRNKWSGPEDLTAVRADTAIAIGMGGLIAILIASTAAASLFAAGMSAESAGDLARQFEPLFGSGAKYVLGVGLFAAGLTSAITAPLATGYAMTEILQFAGGQRSWAFRLISLSVILIGAALSLTGIRPIEIIVTAQFANGLLLPIIAAFLLYVVNQKAVLGRYANGKIANVLGAGVLLIATGLGVRLIVAAFS
ncbi:Nramp family divalent metal transporter [Erythrobacter rubeus]|uniref:Nramp family divalent metal transporter n=1 Tax=Erythrobacter rubeus TaxID=2760803 RepID=A0ABR8KP80_9SPHN|nr:Nramp family divalent metal transporter [Erythrobacter rubeus]MBD2841070.1 Nramp family divalent metal transporter [Erythrobacter rubeus]